MSRFHNRHGVAAYALAYSILKTGATAAQLAQRADIDVNTARGICREMHSLRLVYVSGWKRLPGPGGCVRVFKVGDGTDAVPPLTRRGVVSKVKPPRRHRPRASLIAFSTLLDALAAPLSAAHIAEETGLQEQAVYRFVNYCRSLGLVRIAAWERSGTTRVGLYAVGSGPDAPKPARMTNSEICRRNRQRKAIRRLTARVSANVGHYEVAA